MCRVRRLDRGLLMGGTSQCGALSRVSWSDHGHGFGHGLGPSLTGYPGVCAAHASRNPSRYRGLR